MITQARRRAAAAAAARWITDSGVQVADRRSRVFGAFNAWYDVEEGRFQYVYPEITGYGMTALLYLNALAPEERLVEKARKAGDWTMRRAMHPCGGIRPRDHYDRRERALLFSFERHLVVTFDSGMVLFGLCDLYQATGRPGYLSAARRVGDFLALRARRKDGSFYACYNPSTGRWIDKTDKWSTQSGSYHAKCAMGLLRLARLTGERRYRDAAVGVCEWSLAQQRPNGRFVSWRAEQATHMHPHLYSAEGLLFAGLELQRPDFVTAAARAVGWSLAEQEKDGGLPCAIGERGLRNPHQRSDTLAQCLRLGALLRGRGLAPASWERPLARLEAKLLGYQRRGGPHAGGFAYGEEMNGERREHLNFWGTSFALQALRMRADAIDGKVPSLEHFV